MKNMPIPPFAVSAAPPSWAMRLMKCGFLFFLAKGMLWLTLLAVLAITGSA